MENLVIMNHIENLAGKRVLLTGHTGFKGSWLSLMLLQAGAEPAGYALPPTSGRDNFTLCGLPDQMQSYFGDILDTAKLARVFKELRPELVLHLAAQPLVLAGYEEPAHTFMVNVQGTVNVLEAFRRSETAKALIVVTTDKVYENKENEKGYRETDRLGGHDPYSASKAAAELVTESYRRSFFPESAGKSVSTVRAGNVIGGGDWSVNRIIPDCIRALEDDVSLVIRNPMAVRPWQYVLEPLYGYLMLADRMLDSPTVSGSWNFGPDASHCTTVEEIVSLVSRHYGLPGIKKEYQVSTAHETQLLLLDSRKAMEQLDWQCLLGVEDMVEETVRWYQQYRSGDMFRYCMNTIARYSQLWKLQHTI